MTRLFVLALALILASARANAAFPTPQGPVTDAARVLTGTAKPDLTERLREVERTTSAEIALVTVSTLDGMSIEEYATRLFQEWGVGQRSRDNGVLILFAPNEREIRIEVGYGLESILPDGLAGEIIRDEALPAFRFRNYSGGLVATTQRVASIVERNERVSPEELARLAQQDRGAFDPGTALFTVPLFGASIFFGLFQLLRGIRFRDTADIVKGGGFAGVPVAASAFLPELGAPFPIVIAVGLGALVICFFLLRRRATPGPPADAGERLERQIANEEAWRKFNEERGYSNEPEPDAGARRQRSGDRTADGWRSSGWSSPAGRSGSSSSDRFGGGRSGGGGASGKW